jgi:PDZ domain
VLGMKFERTFQVLGSDLSKPLTAYLVRGTRLEMPERMIAPQEDVLVLEEDCFRFEEYIGMTIHGILSANAFAKYFIKINYDKKVMTLYDREHFSNRELKGYQSFPIEINREKPYFNTTLHMTPDSTVDVKLLLDTGAGMPLLLFTHTHTMLKPPPTAIAADIGMGLGGNIAGFIGRIPGVGLGSFSEKNVITYFQVLDSTIQIESANSRNGVVGNGMLRRYIVIFDYYGAKVWLKPGKYFKNGYTYDRSGLSIIASGASMNSYIIQGVIPGSPAAEADIRKGDRIVKIGRNPAFFVSMAYVLKKMQGKPGKKVRLVVDRSGERLEKTIILRDIL